MTNKNILVLSDNKLTPGLRGQLEGYMRKLQFPMMQVRFDTELTKGLQTKKGKTKMQADPAKYDLFKAGLQRLLNKHDPGLIIINDWVTLEYVTGFRSLDLLRGSVYFINGIPAVVVDSLRTATGAAKLKAVKHAGWLLQNDLKKAKRWYDGTQMAEPVFNYRVCRTLADVQELYDAAVSAIAVAMDIETTGVGETARITCSGYSVLTDAGAVRSFVVPFLDPFATDGKYWTDAEFEAMLLLLQKVHDTAAPKVLQNGTYDAHYYIRYRLPVRNWFMDTAVGFHSIWPELPKRIDFIASVAVDHYRYWKAEGKADAKDDDKAGALPTTQEGWQRYLRYNALDCHYTLLCMMWEIKLLHGVDWAMENYRQSMRQVLGPALAMSLRGVNVNQRMQTAYAQKNYSEHECALTDLRIMVGDKEFNPNSPPQVASLLYDVLGCTPLPKRGAKKSNAARSTNEKDLEIIRTQHPLFDRVIRQIWDSKKPLNNSSKYGTNGLRLFNNRWMYLMNAIGTENARYASKQSHFWVGTQVQNVPYPMRCLIEPDPGYVLFELDYSKADFWHTAFASQEPNMMEIVQLEANGGTYEGKPADVHCYHASKFFQKAYPEIYDGYKAKDEWVVESLHGVRQNSKRIVYGANYLMAGYTLFLTMGKEAVDATAEAMGYSTAGWGINDYARFCQGLIDFYFQDMYPMLMPWLENTIHNVARNGNKAVCCGNRTRTFFASLYNDKGAQRELAAFYGQAGTALTINRALDNVYYSNFDTQNCMLLFQVHDAVIGQVKIEHLHLLGELKKLMEVENEINGHTFVIPADGTVGFGWGYRQTDWHPDITIDEIAEADKKWQAKNKDLMALM